MAAFQLLATMYVKYVQSFRRLEDCYDQITHAQKRRLLRHVLDACIGRIIELKHEMIQLEFSEYHFFDDVLQDLKLTPVSALKNSYLHTHENFFLILLNSRMTLSCPCQSIS